MWKTVCGFLRKVGYVFSVKKVWGMELHFIKGEGSESVLELIIFGWKIRDRLIWYRNVEVLWEVDPEKRVLHGCDWQSLEYN